MYWAVAVVAIFLVVVLTVGKQRRSNPSPTDAQRSLHPRHSAPSLHIHLPNVGTEPATDAQDEAVRRLGYENLPELVTWQQADWILSARDYVLAVMDRSDDASDMSPQRRSMLLSLTIADIMEDVELAQKIDEWNDRRFKRGTHNDAPNLRNDWKIERVVRLLQNNSLRI